jgi:hypothetical protein
MEGGGEGEEGRPQALREFNSLKTTFLHAPLVPSPARLSPPPPPALVRPESFRRLFIRYSATGRLDSLPLPCHSSTLPASCVPACLPPRLSVCPFLASPASLDWTQPLRVNPFLRSPTALLAVEDRSWVNDRTELAIELTVALAEAVALEGSDGMVGRRGTLVMPGRPLTPAAPPPLVAVPLPLGGPGGGEG